MIEGSFTIISQIGLGAALVTVAASILFGLRGIPVGYNGIIGMVSYLLTIYFAHLGPFVSTAIGATVLSLMGQVGARIFKAPVTVFLIPCIYPLVPGTAIYRMVSSFLIGNNSQGMEFALEAIMVSTAVALGYVIAETIFLLIYNAMKRIKPDSNIRKIM